jgi:hypothetical protein
VAQRVWKNHRTHEGAARYWPIVFAGICAGILGFAAAHPPKYPIYEFHNVKVIKQVGDNAWWIQREDGLTLWNGCDDFPNNRVIWAGYVMTKFRYEDQGNCKSILRSDLGAWWERDSTGNVKETR